jgi:uracil-DNA glycosylase
MGDDVMTLDLDARQRAMLQEMHIPVWWPVAQVAQAVQADAPVAEPQTVRRTAPAGAVSDEPTGRRSREERQGGTIPVAPVTSTNPVAPPILQRAERPSGIETMGWAELQQAVAGCTACQLCSTRKNTVFGVGPAAPADGVAPRADWMIVGEAPGENEDVQGEPFVGQAGKLLDNMLRAIGVSRNEPDAAPPRSAFITNVLKCRPPANRNPEPDEVAQCEPFLKRQIELLQPKIILAVGKFSVQSLLQETVPDVQTTPLGRLRGKAYSYHGVPVVVSYHPAYLLRSLPEKAKAWADLCLAMAVKKEKDVA